MKKYKVDYSEAGGQAKKTGVFPAPSSQSLYEKLSEKYPHLEIHGISEVALEQDTPAQNPSSSGESQPDASDSGPVNSSQPSLASSSEVLWASQVELYPYSSSAIIRVLIFLYKILNLILGIRSKGLLSEFEDEISITTKSYVFWVFSVEDEVTWVKKKSLSAVTRLTKKSLFGTHFFLTIQYSGGVNASMWWVKNVSSHELDSTVSRWLSHGR